MRDSKKRTIGLVQIAEVSWQHRRREQYRIVDGLLLPKMFYASDVQPQFTYLPLAVGSLQAYVQRYAAHRERFRFLPPVFERTTVRKAVDCLAGADIVGFSVYVWNINLSLEIAKELKRLNRGVLIVFGGPQVPDHCEQFLRDNPQVDLACHGEGERVFLTILDRADSGGWADCPSVSYLDEGGAFRSNARMQRLTDLTELPSPFTAGVFDEIMTANPDRQWLALWETNRGCPFSCTFCDWGSAVGSKVTKFTMERLFSDIEWLVERRISHLFICDANFGMLPRDVDIARQLVARYEEANLPLAISIQNTKNATERAYQIQKALTASRLVTFGVTLSMQSISPPVLQAIKRNNISLDSFHELHVRYQKDGVETYSDLIVGLPGETYESFSDGISRLLDRGQHNRVAFYNCSVLPNAEMGDPDYQAKHGIEYVPMEIIREHEALDRKEREEVREFINIVVGTAAMNREEWVKTRTFAWFIDLLHFDRVLQIVFVVLREMCGIEYRRQVDALMNADAERFQVCAWLRQLFAEHARGMQRGEPELFPSPKWLNVWWPGDQYALVSLVCEGKIDAFYDEAEQVLTELVLKSGGSSAELEMLGDAIALNRAMLRVPSQVEDIEIDVSYNLLEFHRAICSGAREPLRAIPSRYHIDRTSTVWVTEPDWCEDVVVQVYRRSNFLYPASRIELDMAALPLYALADGGPVAERGTD